ncbi:antibiotic ABC transporter ATP-binding protein [Clostridiales bacterium PH28_bin88]|nr:antibiotic ABC transporter ATP-binding protein [Clostridiales bacterium PH28_bin88]
MITINNLRKEFKQVKAVDGINLEVKEGEILGILGPNGAGKSTTISMISTLIKPTAGEILFEGESILQNPLAIRRALGVVPQDIALYTDLTGRENLHFFGRVNGLKGKALAERVEEVLITIGLQERAGDQVKQYSGGMKRRVNIGAALLHRPRVLIMDEPTVGIDPQSRNHILETVRELNRQGMTVIYTSHYMEEVEYLCHRIYIMDHGKVIAAGTQEELKRLVPGENAVEMKVELITPEFLKNVKDLPGVADVLADNGHLTLTLADGQSVIGEVFGAAAKHKVKILSIDIKAPTLEAVFLSLTGRGLRD